MDRRLKKFLESLTVNATVSREDERCTWKGCPRVGRHAVEDDFVCDVCLSEALTFCIDKNFPSGD